MIHVTLIKKYLGTIGYLVVLNSSHRILMITVKLQEPQSFHLYVSQFRAQWGASPDTYYVDVPRAVHCILIGRGYGSISGDPSTYFVSKLYKKSWHYLCLLLPPTSRNPQYFIDPSAGGLHCVICGLIVQRIFILWTLYLCIILYNRPTNRY